MIYSPSKAQWVHALSSSQSSECRSQHNHVLCLSSQKGRWGCSESVSSFAGLIRLGSHSRLLPRECLLPDHLVDNKQSWLRQQNQFNYLLPVARKNWALGRGHLKQFRKQPVPQGESALAGLDPMASQHLQGQVTVPQGLSASSGEGSGRQEESEPSRAVNSLASMESQ